MEHFFWKKNIFRKKHEKVFLGGVIIFEEKRGSNDRNEYNLFLEIIRFWIFFPLIYFLKKKQYFLGKPRKTVFEEHKKFFF